MKSILFLLVLLIAASCSKPVIVANPEPERVFIRVQEVSNDNVVSYSTVVTVKIQ